MKGLEKTKRMTKIITMNSVNMKNIIVLFVTTIIISLPSCSEDFLEQPPRSALTAGSFPVSAEDADLATNAVYNILRSWQLVTGGYPLLDMMSDDAVKGSNPGDGSAIAVYDNFKHDPTEGSVERWYKTLYEAIRRSNLVINEVPKINMNKDKQAIYVAEARFLRAYFYSDLVRGFGDVPKVTVTEVPLDLQREKVDVILKDIIYPDLENGIAVLPERSSIPAAQMGRITKGAARAMLARMKLFYGDFTTVENLCSDILKSNQYSLMPKYGDVHSSFFEHNVESIFEISALPQSFSNGGNQFGNTQGIRGTPNKGWGFCRPAYAWISEMQVTRDPRLEPSVIFLNEVKDGILISGDGGTPDTTYVNGRIVEIECYNEKVWVAGLDGLSGWGHNRRILRYADVLLMYAEALNENNKSSLALIELNKVRRRARGTNTNVLPDINLADKAQIRNAILNERKFEFALEGLRFWDLVRTNKAVEVLGPLGFVKGKNELFPIPQSEVDISQGRITQNTGY